jgi:hypothetical protein
VKSVKTKPAPNVNDHVELVSTMYILPLKWLNTPHTFMTDLTTITFIYWKHEDVTLPHVLSFKNENQPEACIKIKFVLRTVNTLLGYGNQSMPRREIISVCSENTNVEMCSVGRTYHFGALSLMVLLLQMKV